MNDTRKKILLIRQKAANTLYLNASYALAMVSAILKPIADVKVLDNNGKYRQYSDDDILSIIGSYQPDIIGFNVTMYNAYFSYELINRIHHEYLHIPLIAGGVHSNQCAEEIAAHPVVVVRGEAERTLPKLISALSETFFKNGNRFNVDVYDAMSEIGGLLFKNHNGEIIDTGPGEIFQDLDQLPYAEFDQFNLKDFIRVHRDHIGSSNMIISQRGCPFTCIYCKSSDFGGKIRETSPEYLVKHIEHIYSKNPNKHIYFMDDNFTLHRDRVVRFCNLFIDSGLHRNISLECQTNILCPLDDEMLSLMIKANFTRLQFGIDRFTTFGVKTAKIRPSNESLIPKLDLLKKHGMKTMFTVLLGMDFDNAGSVKAEYERLKQIKDYAQVFGVSLVVPVPGTELYKRHPELKEWYLDPDFAEGGHHYYDFALATETKAHEKNFFNMPEKTLREILDIQLYSLKFNTKSLFGKKGIFIYYPEKALILLSFYLSKVFPRLEYRLFSPVKELRMFLIRLVYDLVYYKEKKKGAPSSKPSISSNKLRSTTLRRRNRALS